MKITLTSGQIIDVTGEEFSAILPHLPAFMQQLAQADVTTIETDIPAPEAADPEIETAPAPGPASAQRKTGPHQPRLIFVGEKTAPVYHVLKMYPAGLTSKKVAEVLGVTQSTASSSIHRLRFPIALAEQLPGGIFRLTALGERVKVKSSPGRTAKKKNVELGWAPWMGL